MFRFWFALALGLALMPGCSDENGEGGNGGRAGVGGIGGQGGTARACEGAECERYHDCDDGNQCTEDAWEGDACENMPVINGLACDDENQCTTSACIEGMCEAAPVENSTPCYPNPMSLVQGTCTEGRCIVICDAVEDCDFGQNSQCVSFACSNGICESTPVENGTACDADLSSSALEGNCYAGECELPCATDDDCTGPDDCSVGFCAQLDGGSRCEQNMVPDGTPCAGGGCQLGRCQVTTFEMPCTEQALHNAMMAGCGPYTFDCDGPTTLVTDAIVVIDKDVILDGEEKLRIDGNQEHTLFVVNNGVTAELCGFEITGGIDSGIENHGTLTLTNTEVSGNRGEYGGGLHNDGTLSLRVSAVVDNRASHRGGGIFNRGNLHLASSTVSDNSAGLDGGGLYNTTTGKLHLSKSTVSDNRVSETGRGGGIYNFQGRLTLDDSAVSANIGGGLYDDRGVLTLNDSAVSGNTTPGWCGAGIYSSYGALTLTNSTVSENEGCGIFVWGFNDPDVPAEGTLTLMDSTVTNNFGGGIHTDGRLMLIDSTVSGNTAGPGISSGAQAMLVNSTVSGNTNPAGEPGGGGGISLTGGILALVNSTVSGNSATRGDGIYIGFGAVVVANSTLSDGVLASATSLARDRPSFEVVASLVQAACTQEGPGDASWTSNGHNIESPGNTCGFDQDSDQVNVSADDLKLGPLQDNGGPTMTRALGEGSVAIDKIPAEDCVDADGAPLTTDQRGEPRPVAIIEPRPKCDVGAFELQQREVDVK